MFDRFLSFLALIKLSMNRACYNALSSYLPPQLFLNIFVNNKRFAAKKEEMGKILIPHLTAMRRCVDVGGNNGSLAIFFHQMGFETVECFEPNVSLTKNIKKLGLPNLTVHDLGLSDRVGATIMYVPKKFGVSYFGLGSLHNKFTSSNSLEVNVVTLDSYGYDDVDLLKIDVEGWELMVLQGAKKTIKNCKPVILIEVEERHSGLDPSIILEMIESFGYGVHSLGPKPDLNKELKTYQKGVGDTEFIMPRNKAHATNFLCTPL